MLSLIFSGFFCAFLASRAFWCSSGFSGFSVLFFGFSVCFFFLKKKIFFLSFRVFRGFVFLGWRFSVFSVFSGVRGCSGVFGGSVPRGCTGEEERREGGSSVFFRRVFGGFQGGCSVFGRFSGGSGGFSVRGFGRVRFFFLCFLFFSEVFGGVSGGREGSGFSGFSGAFGALEQKMLVLLQVIAQSAFVCYYCEAKTSSMSQMMRLKMGA